MSQQPVGPCAQRGEEGYTLIELLVATAIMLGVTGTIVSLVIPSQSMFRVQPEVSTLHQRMRVGADMLFKDLLMAGAGMYSGPASGPLINLFAPVMPYRMGLIDPDPPQGVFFRRDAITLLYVPSTASQTTISQPMPGGSTEIKVDALPGCPVNDPLCGFSTRQTVVIFDETGGMDTFTITQVQAQGLRVQHRNQVLSKPYEKGAFIAEVETHTYYRDATTDQLRRYDGWKSDVPLIDDVVGLSFRYFGDPDPPQSPKPTVGTANCLFDTAGNAVLPTLTPSGLLVELTQSALTDGPWCGASGSPFDADLYRIRRVRVDLRVQVAAVDLRGPDLTLFVRLGEGRIGTRLVPDYKMSFDVAPRNMNLM